MADLFDNPLGTDGFEFVEFTAPEPAMLAAHFERMGFTAVSRHRSKDVVRYKQGDINFLLNIEPAGQVAKFRLARGPSANAMAFRAKDAAALQRIYDQINQLEREPVQTKTYVRYTELFRWPLSLAILALAGELLLAAWRGHESSAECASQSPSGPQPAQERSQAR